MVDKLLLKPVGAPPPILLQVLGQEAGDYHSSPIGHEASSVHVSNQSVDDRVSCATFPPTFDSLHVVLPGIVSSVVDPVGAEYFVAVVEAPIPLEISPEELIHKDPS